MSRQTIAHQSQPIAARGALRKVLVLGLVACIAACAGPRPAPPPPAPAPETPVFSQEGTASWYGPAHNGRTTANGETFDMQALTAAHRSLPFGAVVRVTNLENGRTVKVRINDRGPYVKNRIIDLSARAARDLGIKAGGVARVRIEQFASDQPMS
jgi:rare lipoprotein A